VFQEWLAILDTVVWSNFDANTGSDDDTGCVDEDLSELAKEVRRLLEGLNGHTFVLKHLQNGLCTTSQV
jgi:hypothetical protein